MTVSVSEQKADRMTDSASEQLNRFLLETIVGEMQVTAWSSDFPKVIHAVQPKIEEFLIANGQELVDVDRVLEELPAKIAKWLPS